MDDKTQNKKISVLVLALYFIKTILAPFKANLSFVASDIASSIKKDSYKILAITALSILIVILTALFWITLGAGLIILAISGYGDLFKAWSYIALFEIVSIATFAIIIAILKASFKSKEAIERARRLLLKK